MKLQKTWYPGQHHHVQYLVDELRSKKDEDFLIEFIDSCSDSKIGKATQKVCDILFLEGKTLTKKGFNTFHKAKYEVYEINDLEAQFYLILSRILRDKGFNQCKFVEELAGLSKKEIEQRLILWKVTK